MYQNPFENYNVMYALCELEFCIIPNVARSQVGCTYCWKLAPWIERERERGTV